MVQTTGIISSTRTWVVSLVIVGCMVLAGCSSTPPEAESDVGQGLPRLEGTATVAMVVKGETITIEVNGADAPITAGNFVDLVQKGVYDGVAFHRVVREPQPFVVQGGDPQSTNPSVPIEQLGTGGYIDPETSSQRYIPLEIKPAGADLPVYSQTFSTAGISQPPELTHERGAVAMARSQFPDSASSQFYIALARLNFLDGEYAVFGQVTDGMDVVDQIQQGDRIESARVIEGSDNLILP
ncbi:MAG: peptidylprolyl isomerase [Leptolyngbyaceae bacterium]|nr:peptidylprolyl isomerase [Leptolyngbyaceae bacterium]